MVAENQALQSGVAGMRKSPWAAFTNFHNIRMIFALAAALTLAVAMILWTIQPNYTPLYNKLSDVDTAKIIETLRAENISFRIEPGSGMITVPDDQLQEVRMKLAAAGLSQGMSRGFEVLQEEQSLGTSQFMENARYQHILETELSRTIGNMRNIENARVHLAMPKQSAFVRKRDKTSASVLLKLLSGRSLEQDQVASIVHLVSSSVPYLEAGQVTVVDQWGRLLTSKESSAEMLQTTRQFEFSRKLEESYQHKIESLLTPVLGLGRVKVEVSAEIDFSVNERTQEVFQPDENKIRSEQLQESRSVGTNVGGIAGALSNQPPGAGTVEPGNAVGQSDVAVENEEARTDIPVNTNRNTTRNYELDRTISHTRNTPGEIRRLTVAVAVDDKVSTDEQGTVTRTPLAVEEVELITRLVKDAIGFREERGDSVVVINKTFQGAVQIEPLPEPSLWDKPWLWSLIKQILGGLVVLFLIFGIIRPALKPTAKTSKKGAAAADDIGEEKLMLTQQQKMMEALPAPPHVYGDILNMARAMAADDPKRVAKVVKDWLSNDV